MNLLLSVLSITLVVYSVQACRHKGCSAFCAGEIKDPTKKLTFYRKIDLDNFNANFKGDERKCVYDDDCNSSAESEICAIVEDEASGYPQTFRNFCELNRYNCDNQNSEYIYYHDEACNDLDPATPSPDDCDCLECDDKPWKPVCAFPKDPNGAQPISFPNYCWLKKYNCETPQYEFLYWHEGICYSDPQPAETAQPPQPASK